MHTLKPLVVAFLLSACGSQVVSSDPPLADGGTVDVSADTSVSLPDAALPLPLDASQPPRIDVPQPPRIDVPQPPVDTGASPIRTLCQQACDRAARDCGRSSARCVDECSAIERLAPARCQSLVTSALQCVVLNGFVCEDDDSDPAPICASAFSAVGDCVNDDRPPPPPPPPITDASVSPPSYPNCAEACEQGRRACGAPVPDCIARCASTGFSAGRCATSYDQYLACVATRGISCPRGVPTPTGTCAALFDRFSSCRSGGIPILDAGSPDV